MGARGRPGARHKDPLTGIESTLAEHSERMGVPLSTLRSRGQKHGWSDERVWRLHGRGSRRRLLVDPWGNRLSVSAHSRLHGIRLQRLFRRVYRYPEGDPRIWEGSRYVHGESSVAAAKAPPSGKEEFVPDPAAGEALRQWAIGWGMGKHLK